MAPLGAKPEKIKAAIKDFKGVKRRYDLHKGKYVYIDDYAHHPEEIKATLVARAFPRKKDNGSISASFVLKN